MSHIDTFTRWFALFGLLLGGFSAAGAQQSSRPMKSPSAVAPSRYRPDRFPKRAKEYYLVTWGIDSMVVKEVESGELVRFDYRIVDPEKARALNDKKYEPYMFDERAHVRLVIPEMEKVGKLRQTNTPVAGKRYWMAFSNKGGLVKAGDRVSVVIGSFRADGLVIQ